MTRDEIQSELTEQRAKLAKAKRSSPSRMTDQRIATCEKLVQELDALLSVA
jgi:hypothetical protein